MLATLQLWQLSSRQLVHLPAQVQLSAVSGPFYAMYVVGHTTCHDVCERDETSGKQRVDHRLIHSIRAIPVQRRRNLAHPWVLPSGTVSLRAYHQVDLWVGAHILEHGNHVGVITREFGRQWTPVSVFRVIRAKHKHNDVSVALHGWSHPWGPGDTGTVMQAKPNSKPNPFL